MSARASAIYLGARALAGIATVCAVSLFARSLGPENYAWLALCTTGAAILSSVLVVPAGQTLARYLPRPGFDTLLPVLARVFLGVVCVLILLAAGLEWSGWLGGLSLRPGVLLGATLLLLAIGMFELSAQFANSRFQAGRYSALFLFKSLGTLMVGGGVLWLGGGEWGVLVVMVLVGVLGSLLICQDAWRSVLSSPWRPGLLREVRGFALMLACISGCAGLLQWSDRWLLAALSDAAATGTYGAMADLIAQTMTMLSSACFLAWFPRMVVAWEGGQRAEVDRLAGRYLGLSLAVMVPAGIGFALLSHEIVGLFLGAAYLGQAAQMVPWLAAAACLGTLRTLVFDVSLFISGRLGTQLANALVAAVTGLLLTWVLVPRVGAYGAAVANVCAQSLGLLLSWWAGRGLIAWRVPVSDLLAIGLAVILMCALVLLVPLSGVAGLLLRVALGVVGFGVGLLLLDGLGVRAWLCQRVRARVA